MSSPSPLLHDDGHPSLGVLAAFSGTRWVPRGPRRIEERRGMALLPPAAGIALHPQSHRAAKHRAPPSPSPSPSVALLIAGSDERCPRFPRETREAHRHAMRQDGRRVDHDEAESTAAQQHVGAPGRARRILRPDHPQPAALAQVRPVPRRERPGSVDVGHPPRSGDGLLGHPTKQRCFPAPARTENFRQPPSWQTPARKCFVERPHSRRQDGSPGGPGGRRGRQWEKIDERLGEHLRGASETCSFRLPRLPPAMRRGE
jgi:hypothetical protein